jgi:hypothetical protein
MQDQVWAIPGTLCGYATSTTLTCVKGDLKHLLLAIEMNIKYLKEVNLTK